MRSGGKLGRLELLNWINELVEADYPRIEALADGVAYCQVMDALFPGQVQLSRLNCTLYSSSTQV